MRINRDNPKKYLLEGLSELFLYFNFNKRKKITNFYSFTNIEKSDRKKTPRELNSFVGGML